MITKCDFLVNKNSDVSTQNLAEYEMSEVKNNQHVKISYHENNRNSDNITHHKFLEVVTYFYQVFVHVFIFSLFESIFFWFYISKEEDQAILNQIEDVVLVGNLFCTNINDDIDFSSLYDYQKGKRVSYNEKVPLNNTIMLNTYLLCTIVMLNMFLKYGQVNVFKMNIDILKNQSVTFLLLFVYEYLFFKNVIYNYVPNSSNKIVKKIFEKCI